MCAVIQLVSGQFNVGNSKLVPALVSYYSKILGGLNMAHKVEKPRSFLSSSPVKMLSNYFGGSTSSVTEAAHNGPKLLQRTPLGNVATLFPSAMPRAASQRDLPPPVGSIKDRHAGADGERPENPLVRLEQTFTGYMASLQARKGYFIARTLLNRSAADELAVNDLYNRLIESPYHLDASAELGTEVVFAAFEKFVRIAWRQQIGPVMTRQALDALQVRASKQVPGDFADFVNFLFADMAPQNRRAFAALIKLLADLLDGCGNDGDRGALTLAFAELLVDAGSAHNYINLLDRLVEDCDRIFDDGGCGAGAGASLQPKGSGGYDSMNSSARHSHKSATGSLTSNTSSLRRKFGLDSLLRQNSKSSDTERPSVWRSLSKHSRNPATGDVLAKVTPAHVSRSRSIDISHAAAGQNKLRRPGSRDRPPIVGAFTSRDDGSQRPASLIQLETIGEPEMEAAAEPPSQKKRRSSLSDLKALMAAASLEDDGEEDTILAGAQRPQTPQPMADSPLMPLMPLMPLRINKQQTAEKFNATPRLLPSPSRIPMSPSQTLSPTQSRRSPRVQKENVAFGSPLEGSHPKLAPAAEVLAAMGPGAPAKSPEPRRPLSKTLSTSQIPTLRPPRVSTAGPVAIPPDSPTRPSTKPSKPPAATPTQSQPRLRLQSPQRLRERLQSEKRAVEDADAALKAELARIAEDMAHVTGARSSQTKTPTTTLSPPAASPSCPNDWEPATELGKLTAAVASLEARLPAALAELAVRQASTQAEVEAALRAAEAKVRAVDQLYREATAENELLYEKFNTELGRIVKALKGKGREDKEELVARAREAGEEVARTKKENARLKREMVSLRALLRAEVGGSGGGT